jgi:hypothetical protein
MIVCYPRAMAVPDPLAAIPANGLDAIEHVKRCTCRLGVSSARKLLQDL